jgi:uncharacterized membrane protein
MQNPPPSLAAKSSTGLDENIAALLTYIFGWVSGLIFFLMEKDSKLVRFHAMQSILLNVLVIVLGIAIWIVFGIIVVVLSQIGGGIAALASLLSFLIVLVFLVVVLGVVILCMVRAYQRQFFKLPVIGNFAENIVNK